MIPTSPPSLMMSSAPGSMPWKASSPSSLSRASNEAFVRSTNSKARLSRGEDSRAETEACEGVTRCPNSRDEENGATNAGPDKSYAVGNKKLPLHSRFKQGKSGSKRSPDSRTNFETTLLKEFYKPVSATTNGKPIKVTNDRLFAASLVKDAITKGPQCKVQLANR